MTASMRIALSVAFSMRSMSLRSRSAQPGGEAVSFARLVLLEVELREIIPLQVVSGLNSGYHFFTRQL